MSVSPSVSVLTPSFNQGRWLGDNLLSVRRQSYESIEHIVVDGGSNDGSVELLQSSTARWVSEPDRGQSHALNKAFAMSTGDIIGWINSDDAYYSTQSVEMAVACFNRFPEAAVVYGHAALVSASGRVLHYAWVPEFSRRVFRFHNFVLQPSVFVRRTAVGMTLVDESLDFSMDRDLWLRLLAQGEQFQRLDAVIGIDRQHPDRKSTAALDLMTKDSAVLIRRYGVPPLDSMRSRRKLIKIAHRLTGACLVRDAATDLAFNGRLDGRAALLVRQVALPRSRMTAAA